MTITAPSTALSPSLIRVDRLTQDILDEMVRRIVSAVDPDQIILFGSYARGEEHRDSDCDLLVIMPSLLPRHKRSVPVHRALNGILMPKDILVYTPDEIDRWKDEPLAFITSIIRTGRMLYRRESE